jgi:putative colanic acid biosynthesis UDP-glucose lipid carrier transferase
MPSYYPPRARQLGVTTTDPSTVFVVKSLLYPVAAVLTLVACLFSWQEPLSGPYFLVAVLAFFGAADLFEAAPVRSSQSVSVSVRFFVDVLFRWVFVISFIWVLLRLSGLSGQVSNAVLVSWTVVTPLVFFCGQTGAGYFLTRGAKSSAQRPRQALIIGVTEIGLHLAAKLSEDALLRTEVVGFFEDRSEDRLPAHGHHRILGNCRSVADYVLTHDINVVYITLPMTRDPRVLNLLDELRDSTVSIYFVPDIFIFNLIQARFDLLSGIPLVAVRESPFFGLHAVTKRLSDILAAGVLITLLSPVLLAIALGVKLSSPGPVIFRQKRYGLNGKSIIVYKFRSMSVTEDGETTYTQVARSDARVTAFGAFIRRTSLDELPQLFNVLEGSMSLVGPRPHAIAVNEQYRRLIPSYMVRHKVKPGITGWAQVHGYRGGDDLVSMQKRIEFDLQYLQHWSLRLDLLIMLKTAVLVLVDRKAY